MLNNISIINIVYSILFVFCLCNHAFAEDQNFQNSVRDQFAVTTKTTPKSVLSGNPEFIDGYYSFNGKDDAFLLDTEGINFDDDTPFSIAMIARFHDNNRFLCSYRWHFQRSSFRTRGRDDSITLRTGIADNEWHSIVVTYQPHAEEQPAAFNLYVDGELIDTAISHGSPLSSYPLRKITLGMTQHSGGIYSTADIKNIYFFDHIINAIVFFQKSHALHIESQNIYTIALVILIIFLLFILLYFKFDHIKQNLHKTINLTSVKNHNVLNAWKFSNLQSNNQYRFYLAVISVFFAIFFSTFILFNYNQYLPLIHNGYINTLKSNFLYIIFFVLLLDFITKKNNNFFLYLILFISTVICFFPIYDNWTAMNIGRGILLQYSDARNYFFGANSLIEHGHLDVWNQRRPINASLMAVRLWFSNGNIMYSLALQSVLLSIALLFSAYQLLKKINITYVFIFVLINIYYINIYMPSTLSESTGLFFGALAFGFLWKGLEENSTSLFAIGIFLLSYALLARSGPFFILPAILIWSFLHTKSKERFSFTFTILASISLAFFINWLYLYIIGTGDNIINSNFSQTLYGMSVGGEGWRQLSIDHPELRRECVDAIKQIYALAFENIKNEPSLFINYYITELLRSPHFIIKMLSEIHIFFIYTSFISLIIIILNYKNRTCSFLIYIFVASLLSSPFLMEDGGTRVYSAIFTTLSILPILSFSFATRFFLNFNETNRAEHCTKSRKNIFLYYVLTVCIIIYIVSPLSFFDGKKSMIKTDIDIQCKSDETQLLIIPGYTITTYYNNSLERHFAPNLHTSVINRSSFIRRTGIPQIDSLNQPFTVILNYPHRYLLYEKGNLYMDKSLSYTVCAVRKSHDDLPSYWYINSISSFLF